MTEPRRRYLGPDGERSVELVGLAREGLETLRGGAADRLRQTEAMLRSLITTCSLALLTAAGFIACAAEPSPPQGALPDGGTSVDKTEPSIDASVERTPATAEKMAAFCGGTYAKLHDAYEACCSASDRETVRYKVVFTQLDAIKASCTPQLQAGVGRLLVDDAALASCTEAFTSFFEGGGCGKNLGPVLDMKIVPGCDLAIAGRQGVDEACLRDYECQDGLTCIGFAGLSEGKCKPPPAIGAACGAGKGDGGADVVVAFAFGDHPTCATGAYCSRSTSRCVAAVEAGGACTDVEECAGGLHCVLGACTTDERSGAGGPCRANKDCSDTTLFCEGATSSKTGTCAAKRPQGSACTASGALGGSSCMGQCVAPAGDASAVCASFCGSG